MSAIGIIQELPINFPCIMCNGGVVYDFSTGEFLLKRFLPDSAVSYIREIILDFPNVGVILIEMKNDREVHHDIGGSYKKTHTEMFPSYNPLTVKLNEVKGSFLKALFITASLEDSRRFIDTVKHKNFTDVEFVTSSAVLCEMLPLGVSKGGALEYLVELNKVEKGQIAAIGDYYNDLEMLSYAGISATMNSSPEELKRVCDYIVCECENGSVADFICKLKRDLALQ
jgi:Cof subfamily protein (haloacid dehalogenase superfamily)